MQTNRMNALRPFFLISIFLLVFTKMSAFSEGRLTPAKNYDFVQMFAAPLNFDPSTEPQISRNEQRFLIELQKTLDTNLAQATKDLNAYLTEDSSAGMYFFLGSFQLQQKDILNAEKSFQQALGHFPSFQRAWQNLAVCKVELGEFPQAIDALGKAISLGANNDQVFGMLGYAYLNVSQDQQALFAYENAAIRNAQNKQWKQGILQCLFNLQHYEEALIMVDGIILEEDDPTDELLLKAKIEYNLNHISAAISALEQASLYAPLRGTDQLLLGDLYLKSNDCSNALKNYQTSLDSSDTNVSSNEMIHRIKILTSRHEWNAARDLIESTEQHFSLSFNAHSNLTLEKSKILLAQGNDEEAIKHLKGALRQTPDKEGVALLIARAYIRSKNYEQAELFFQRAVLHQKDKLPSLLGLAKIRLETNHSSEALLYLQRAYEVEPSPQIETYIKTLREFLKRNI